MVRAGTLDLDRYPLASRTRRSAAPTRPTRPNRSRPASSARGPGGRLSTASTGYFMPTDRLRGFADALRPGVGYPRSFGQA
ncbi:hypothetical protein BRD17_01100 [Halobacteriales archaeon SW_7_68_16]|nr:MAG: hypothetical protein BRD17_01100 [Halobacteriales archaeon SW_7_68_16]